MMTEAEAGCEMWNHIYGQRASERCGSTLRNEHGNCTLKEEEAGGTVKGLLSCLRGKGDV